MAERRISAIVIEPPLPGRAISLYVRARAEYPALVEATVQRLRGAAAAHPGRIVQATSLGAEDMALTDLIARHGIAIDVAMIDTDRLHPETLALRARAEAHCGMRIAVFGPEPAKVADFERQHGPWPMVESVALRHGTSRWRANEMAPAPLVSAANSKSVPTAMYGWIPNPSINSGVMSEPPPTPVKPTMKPTTAPPAM